uniref:Serine/threonine-protein kinase ATM n=1 Tax=Heterorhabditis bacteriophora TaxID=37862 RepID=A0A1I7XRI3_HETBA
MAAPQAEHLDMISCLLSASIDQGDVWAATRLFSSICPEILPTVRKISTECKLSMLQALLSYIMEASIQNNCGTNSVLGKYIGLLKSFDFTVDKMHDEMVSVLDSK